jgi:hypothetical protein
MVPEGKAVDEGVEVGNVGVFHSEVFHNKAKAESYRTGEMAVYGRVLSVVLFFVLYSGTHPLR